MNSRKFSLVIKKPIKNFKKKIIVDSDKSISIRSFLIGSICLGVSSVKNVLESEDVFSTIDCLRKLNVKIKNCGNKNYEVFVAHSLVQADLISAAKTDSAGC